MQIVRACNVKPVRQAQHPRGINVACLMTILCVREGQRRTIHGGVVAFPNWWVGLVVGVVRRCEAVTKRGRLATNWRTWNRHHGGGTQTTGKDASTLLQFESREMGWMASTACFDGMVRWVGGVVNKRCAGRLLRDAAAGKERIQLH